MNTAQNRAAYALFNKLGLMPQKENIISGISNGRTTSTRELDNNESIALIKWLKQQDPEEQKADKMRRKIIAIAHQLGWEKTFITKQGMSRKIDMQALDNWCITFSYLHKKLNLYKYKELPTLVSQFEMVYKHFLNKI
jgi:hypothetical protein